MNLKQSIAMLTGRYYKNIFRWSIAIVTLILGLNLPGCSICRQPSDNFAVKKPGGFLFVTFQEEYTASGEQIYFALSPDGMNWRAMNEYKPVLVSHLGEEGVRDPFILRSHDGKMFYLLATDLNIYRNKDWKRAREAGSKSIVIWDSRDLVHWSAPRLAKVAPDNAGSTWAPEALYDEATGEYLVFWASVTAEDNFTKRRTWAARTKDFKIFSEPFIYIEKSTAILDATIIRDGNNYYRFIKDTKFNALTMELSPGINGPWSNVIGFNLARLQGFEGPTCFQMNPATKNNKAVWALAIDNYAKNEGYHVWVTDNLASGVFKKENSVSFPFKFRHGAVLTLSAAEYSRLKNSYGVVSKKVSN